MSNSCFIQNCQGTTGAQFPRDLQTKEKWIESLKLVEEPTDVNSFICYGHFNEADIKEVNVGGKKRINKIKAGAIPSNPNPCKTPTSLQVVIEEEDEIQSSQEENNENERTTELDASDTCRACMTTENLLTSITDSIEEDVTYGSVFTLCAYPIDVFNDHLSKKFCNLCSETLETFYKFRKKCFESYNSVRSVGESKAVKRKLSISNDLAEKVKKMRSSKFENNENILALMKHFKFEEPEISDPNLDLASNLEVVYEGDKSSVNGDDVQELVEKGAQSNDVVEVQNLTSLQDDVDDIEKNMEAIHREVVQVKDTAELSNIATVEDVLNTLEDNGDKSINDKKHRKVILMSNYMRSSSIKSSDEAPLMRLPKDVKIKAIEKFQSDLGKYECTYRSGVFSSIFLEANDYLYEFGLLKSSTRHLHCALAACSAHAIQKSSGDDTFEACVEVTVPHNHPRPNETSKIKQLFLCVMRKRLKNDKSLNIRNIYEEACKQDNAIRKIIPLRNVINEICRHQLTVKIRDISSFEDFFYSIEFDTFEKLHFTNNFQQFYQEKFVIEEEGSMAVMFGNIEVIKQVCESPVMYVDASFTIDTNEDFKFQLVTVLVWVDESYYPILYTLINKKTQALFRKIFEHLHDVVAPNLRPQEIITDYEANLYYALAETYVDCNIGGSVFYYTQNLYKKICSLNLSKDLETNSYFRNVYHMLLMLPLLPVNTILDGLNSIEVEAKNLKISELARPVFDHIRNTWMLNVTPELFCVHKLEHRINENVIAPFKKLRDFLLLSKGKMQKTHITIVHVVDKIIELEDFLRTTYSKPDKKSFGRDLSSFQKKNVLRAWQFIEDHPKIEINNFFSKVLGYIKCMENQLWIWGFYRYDGDTDDLLINASHFSILNVEEEQIEISDDKAEYIEYVDEPQEEVHTVVMEAVIDQDGVLQTEVETTTVENPSNGQNQHFESAFLKYVYQ